MATDIELAIMAGRAYQSTKKEENWFPAPEGWEEKRPENKESGFEAVYFQRGTGADAEIVISFAGTYLSLTDFRDGLADANLGIGNGDTQLFQAVAYYLQVKADNPNATITLTGHSLGGGLAALVGVFFGEKAVTFDQAPFAFSAQKSGSGEDQKYVPAEILSYLYEQDDLSPALQQAYTKAINSLEDYIAQQASAGGIPNSNLVSNIRVDGESLSDIFPVGKVDFIGTTSTANDLTHGATDLGGMDLHSMALLTAFLQNPAFRKVTDHLTNLLEMIFDKNLFYSETDTNIPNFLDHLLRHEFGNAPGVTTADGMLARFTTDLQGIAQAGGLSMSDVNMTKALTAFAMQAYYENRLAADATLFENISGGLRFNQSQVADDLLNETKGFYLYFADYLATKPVDERALIYEHLPNLLDWFVQAGAGGMTATAGDLRAFMLGSSGSDSYDLLVGGADDYHRRLAA